MRLRIFILPIFLFIISACSYNDGGDTHLWGTWKLDSIDVDGMAVNDYNGNFFWKFQADVILIMEVDDDMHEAEFHYGTWSIADNRKTLTLEFIHSDDENPSGQGVYSPPLSIYITQPYTTLEINTLTSSKLITTYSTETKTITYHLSKW